MKRIIFAILFLMFSLSADEKNSEIINQDLSSKYNADTKTLGGIIYPFADLRPLISDSSLQKSKKEDQIKYELDRANKLFQGKEIYLLSVRIIDVKKIKNNAQLDFEIPVPSYVTDEMISYEDSWYQIGNFHGIPNKRGGYIPIRISKVEKYLDQEKLALNSIVSISARIKKIKYDYGSTYEYVYIDAD